MSTVLYKKKDEYRFEDDKHQENVWIIDSNKTRLNERLRYVPKTVFVITPDLLTGLKSFDCPYCTRYRGIKSNESS